MEPVPFSEFPLWPMAAAAGRVNLAVALVENQTLNFEIARGSRLVATVALAVYVEKLGIESFHEPPDPLDRRHDLRIRTFASHA
jgi:hypothetical protein